MESFAVIHSGFKPQCQQPLTFSGAAYVQLRHGTDTTNGDLNDDSFTESLYNLECGGYGCCWGRRLQWFFR